jgi:hypothetical protein
MRSAKAILAGLLLAAAGCGGDGKTEVSGKVRFDGKLLESGTVWFYGEDGAKSPSAIGPKGDYAVYAVKTGKVVIVVDPRASPVRPSPPRRGEEARRGRRQLEDPGTLHQQQDLAPERRLARGRQQARHRPRTLSLGVAAPPGLVRTAAFS